MIDYQRDPAEIYRRSFATIRREAALAGIPTTLEPVVVRLIHACGMTDIVRDLAYAPEVAARASAALRDGAPILCDCRMVADGIIKSRLPAGNEIVCTIDSDDVPSTAHRLGTTRSAAAVELWRPWLIGSVVAIGNAPTALFHLLEMLDEGLAQPAAILAFPVGFVGAAESKAMLASGSRGVPFLTLRGRRGGSAMAAAAVNALASAEETS